MLFAQIFIFLIRSLRYFFINLIATNMRKFTFFLILIFTVLVSNGQNSVTLQKRVEAAKEKYSRVSDLNSLLINNSTPLMKWKLSSENALKSAAATMKLDSTITKVWSDATQALENDSKEEFMYDAEMKNTMWLNSEWDAASNSWIVWSKLEMLYNEDGSVNSINVFEIAEDDVKLKLITVMGAHYNNAGQLDSVVYWNVENDLIAIIEGKQIYHYNDSGQLTEMKMWSLEEDEGEEYMSVMQFVFTYNNSGRMETSSMFFLFEEEEILFFKTDYYYDSSDRLTYTEDWSLNLMSFELEKDFRSDFDYNASGDISTDTYSEWDQAGQTWVVIETDEYNYNNFNYSEVFFPSYLMLFGIVEEFPVLSKAVAEIETMEWMEGTARLASNTTFYYSAGTTTNVTNLENFTVSVYPNPFIETVTLRWKNSYEPLKLEIYQISGSRVKEVQAISGEPVSLAGLQSGVYLFKLKNNSETLHTGKLVKK